MKQPRQRSYRRRSQIVFWILSVLVVLSMILGLAASIISQPSPAAPTSVPLSFHFAIGGEDASDPSAYRRFLAQVAGDGNLFLVHTGDLTSYGSESSFQDFASLMADFQLPFLPVPGDGDYYQGTLDSFLQYSGSPGPHYAFDYGSVHFVVVDVSLGEVTSEELAWLRADLVASQQPVKMVVLHYPPLNMAGVPDSTLSASESFVALMEREDVDWVFAGHAPGYHTAERHGVHYVVTSAPDPSLDQGPQKGNLHHYVRVTVQGTEVTVDMVPLAAG